MTNETPAWLTAEFLQKILRNSECDESIEVKDVATEIATAKGDNYLSTMIRVQVKYSYDKLSCNIAKTISLIVKISPMVEGIHKDFVMQLGAFQKEIEMLQTSLVTMNDLLNDLPDEKHCRLGPRVLYTQVGDPSFLVMEDLASLGYRMASRQDGLDLQHCLIVFRNLAKLHACSVALCEKDPKLKVRYASGFFDVNSSEQVKSFMVRGIKKLGMAVVDWPELGSDGPVYSEKLLKLSEGYFEKLLKCIEMKPDEFNVINHGDCWVNNMLFRYNDEAQVIDQIFVDYQGSHWNSPIQDILNFLSTSISEDVDLHHREILIAEYLNVLTQIMMRFGCKTKAPTQDIFQKTMKERLIYDLGYTCMSLPIIITDPNEAQDLEELLEKSDDYVTPIYNTSKLRNIMIRRLRVWDVEGLLDC